PLGHNQWTSHGDHAVTKVSDIFHDEAQFRSLTGWDFSTIWEWRAQGSKGYPVLKGLANQVCPLSETYFSYSTSLQEAFGAEEDDFRVGPNPTNGELHIISSSGILGYTLYSINGGMVMSGEASGSNEAVIDLGGLADGLYILRSVTADGIEKINKVIKK
ncbi:MAG: T9SS type A sorting domain-containing protein, partial [Muribaculaceae bacterium]|nr:T9SS type A sorting domain-containing protein [Muribaculaceae bacterium]